MARKPKQKPQTEAPKSFDESVPFDADDAGDDGGMVEPDLPDVTPQTKLRDWRDVERYKEMRELRKVVGDDLDADLDPD